MMSDSHSTKAAFGDALKELLKTQPFEKVTVSSICNQCDMKRTSFYYHFLDKYDLVNWIFDTEYIAFLTEDLGLEDIPVGTVPEGFNSWDFVRATAAYFYQNLGFYQNIMTFTGQNSFSDHFRDLLMPILTEMLRDQLKDRESVEFHVTFFSDAILAALKRWISDPKRPDPETFVRLLQSCVQVSADYLESDLGHIE